MDRFLAQDFCSTIYLSIDSSSRGTDFLVQRWSCQRPETAGQAALGWEVQDLSTRTHQFPKEQKSCSKISQKPGVTRPGGLEGSRPSRADLQGANMSGLPVVSCKPCHRWEQLLNKASYPRNGNIPKSCVLNVVHWFGVHWLCQSSYIDLTLWGARFGWASRLSIPSQGSPPEVTEKFQIFSFCIFACLSLSLSTWPDVEYVWICMNIYNPQSAPPPPQFHPPADIGESRVSLESEIQRSWIFLLTVHGHTEYETESFLELLDIYLNCIMQSGSSLAIMLVPFKGIRSIIRKLCIHWKFSTKNGENNSWHFTEWSAMSHLKDGAANQILSSPRAVDVRLVADPLETELRFDHIDMTDSWVRKKSYVYTIAYGFVHVANAIYEIDTVTIKSQRW